MRKTLVTLLAVALVIPALAVGQPGGPQVAQPSDVQLAKPGDARVGKPKPSAITRAETRIVNCANAARRKNGLPALKTSSVLGKAARFHARNMARLGFFDHTDPQGRGPAERVAIFDSGHVFTGIGENIAAGYGSTGEACNGWLHSSGHRANILSPGYTYIGGGYATGGPYGRYYVQVFGSTR